MVKAPVAGRHGPGNGLLTLTDQRLFFFFGGLVRDDYLSNSLKEIATLGWETAINLGKLTIHAGSAIGVSGIDKDAGEVFINKLNDERATQGAS